MADKNWLKKIGTRYQDMMGWNENRIDSVDYKFDPDPREESIQKGDYSFFLNLGTPEGNLNVNPNDVRDIVYQELTDKIGFSNYLSMSNNLVCRTTKETLKDIFGVEVDDRNNFIQEPIIPEVLLPYVNAVYPNRIIGPKKY